MELNAQQVFLVGIVASGLSVVIRFLAAKFGVALSKFGMTIVVSVASVTLAVIFDLPSLPVYTEPLPYLLEWLALASAYLGFATAIYNLIIDKVLTATNLTIERFLKS